MLLEPSRTITMSMGPPQSGKTETREVVKAFSAFSRKWRDRNTRHVFIYSGQRVRTRAEAERGGSVLHICQGRSAGCHTAAPTEAHTSVTEQKGTAGWSLPQKGPRTLAAKVEPATCACDCRLHEMNSHVPASRCRQASG